MKVLKSTIVFVALLFLVQTVAAASSPTDRDKALDMYKEYVNNMIHRVEKVEDPIEKRKVLNNSFDNMISALETTLAMGGISQKDKNAINTLKADIRDKKNELNGKNGYDRVADNKLNNFANFIQQDLEQADTVTISLSVTLLIVIIVLLLIL